MSKKKRRFSIHIEVDFDLDLARAVVSKRQLRAAGDCLNGDPESMTAEDAAKHIAYNLIANQLQLESIDGFANLKNDFARIDGVVAHHGAPSWEVEATEIT